MFIRRHALIALVLLAPTIALAQRGGGMGGGRGGGMNGRNGTFNQGPTDAQLGAVNTKDVDKVNPLNILLDKKKDLKLVDSTVKAYKKMQSTLKDTLKPRFKAIDSLNKELRPRNADQPTDDDTVRAENARHQLGVISTSIRARYDSVKSLAFAYLDIDQQDKANTFIEQVRSDVAESQRQAMAPTRSSNMGGRNGSTGGRGGSYGGQGGTRTGGARSNLITTKDLEQLNPLSTILAKKIDLALDDTTVKQLDPINRALIASVAPDLRTVDSLTTAIQQAGGSTASEAAPAVTQLNSLATKIRAQYDVAQSSAFTLLTPDQRTAAAILIERVRADIQNRTR